MWKLLAATIVGIGLIVSALFWIDPHFYKSLTVETFAVLLGGIGSSFALIFLAATTHSQHKQATSQSDEWHQTLLELQNQTSKLAESAKAQVRQADLMQKTADAQFQQTITLTAHTEAAKDQAVSLTNSIESQTALTKEMIAGQAAANELAKTAALDRRVDNFIKFIIQSSARLTLRYGSKPDTKLLLGSTDELARLYSTLPSLAATKAQRNLGNVLKTIGDIVTDSWEEFERVVNDAVKALQLIENSR